MFSALKSFYLSLFLSHRAYGAGVLAVVLFVVAFFVPVVELVAKLVLALAAVSVVVDGLLLYTTGRGFAARREMMDRFSNGEHNYVHLHVHNTYGFAVRATLVDELPTEFQERHWKRRLALAAGEEQVSTYTLTPHQRGEYDFGKLHVFVRSPLGLIDRRYSFALETMVRVYPAFNQLRRYQLLAATGASEAGLSKLRRMGHSLEFEQIKEYVRGDDMRTINWKASARKGQLMANHFVDERSQHIYCVVDKGRLMKMPFGGMTLLDYAINASLVLANVALLRQDKAGLVTFAEKTDTFLPAERTALQMETILESLYKQQTGFKESDFEHLYAQVRQKIKQRSLLVLFTNFESIHSLRRQLPYLKAIGRYHLLLVVFFENTELYQLETQPAATLEDIYIKTIGNRFAYEKRLIARELRQSGVLTLLTQPENLGIDTVNKYLEIKSRQAL